MAVLSDSLEQAQMEAVMAASALEGPDDHSEEMVVKNTFLHVKQKRALRRVHTEPTDPTQVPAAAPSTEPTNAAAPSMPLSPRAPVTPLVLTQLGDSKSGSPSPGSDAETLGDEGWNIMTTFDSGSELSWEYLEDRALSTPEVTPRWRNGHSTKSTPSYATTTPSYDPMTFMPTSYAEGHFFDVTLRLDCDTGLGVDVVPWYGALYIKAVIPHGAVESWNRQCFASKGFGKGPSSLHRALVPGDAIVCINGLSDAADMMSMATDTATFLLKMTLCRYSDAQRWIDGVEVFHCQRLPASRPRLPSSLQ